MQSQSRECVVACFGECIGPAQQTLSCNTQLCRECSDSVQYAYYSTHCFVIPAAIDCEYAWSDWSSCTSCGVGLVSRTVIVSQPSENGGITCPSGQIQAKSCVISLCNDCSNPANGPNHLGCINNGICNDTMPYDNKFTCSCPPGFLGANCEICKSLDSTLCILDSTLCIYHIA